MKSIDEDDFLEWKALVASWGDGIGLAGFLLVVSCAIVLVGTCAVVWPFVPEGRYLMILLLAPGLLVGIIWFQLAARMFYRLHLALGPHGRVPRPRPRALNPIQDHGPLRCQSCGRFAAARWQRCPFCRGSTGSPRGACFFVVDERLSSLRALGIGVTLAPGVAVAFLAAESPDRGAVAGLFTFLFLCAHVFAPWHFAGWVASFAGWISLALGCVAALQTEGSLAMLSLLPLMVASWMLVRWRSSRARLRGAAQLTVRDDPSFQPITDVPAWSPCIECGSQQSKLLAPVCCVSLGFSLRWVLPLRALCLEHARRRALGPSIVTLLFGWWGIPFGPIWSADAIMTNLDGGATIESETLRELSKQEEERGETLSASSAFEFLVGVVLGGTLVMASWSHIAH